MEQVGDCCSTIASVPTNMLPYTSQLLESSGHGRHPAMVLVHSFANPPFSILSTGLFCGHGRHPAMLVHLFANPPFSIWPTGLFCIVRCRIERSQVVKDDGHRPLSSLLYYEIMCLTAFSPTISSCIHLSMRQVPFLIERSQVTDGRRTPSEQFAV